MNLFYEEYPCSVTVHGRNIPIITDFREYIKLLDMLKDTEIPDLCKMQFLTEYFLTEVSDWKEAFDQLSIFVSMETLDKAGTISGKETEGEEDLRAEKPLFSFSVDYPYILSGFLRDYGIDLETVDYLHWWKFRALFDGLSEDTEIKQQIMYRSMDLSTIKDKEERKRIQKIQRAIQLPAEALSDYDIGNAFA